MMASGIHLQSGKFYVTRDGRKAGPAQDNTAMCFGFLCCAFTVPLDGHPATYWPEGHRIGEGCEDPEDLIAEWPL